MEKKPCVVCKRKPAVAKGKCHACYERERRKDPKVKAERRTCARRYYAAHRAQVKAANKRSDKRNKAKRRAYAKAYYARNKEKLNALCKVWRDNLPEWRKNSITASHALHDKIRQLRKKVFAHVKHCKICKRFKRPCARIETTLEKVCAYEATYAATFFGKATKARKLVVPHAPMPNGLRESDAIPHCELDLGKQWGSVQRVWCNTHRKYHFAKD